MANEEESKGEQMSFKKAELSANVLAFLLVVAIVVSVGGTLVSLSKLRATSLESITGGVTTGTTTATVTNVTAISLTTSTVAFGSVSVKTKYDTTGGSPAPFAIQNDGNVPINITLNGTRIFNSSNSNESSYQFKCRANEGPNCPAGSPSTFSNIPLDNDTLKSTTAVFDLEGGNANDSRFVDIQVYVPVDETGGAKTSTLTFTAAQI